MTVPNALIIVDPQNDFVTGSLAVPNAASIFPNINVIAPLFQTVAITVDNHPADHASFIANGGTWPPHCIAGTRGAYVTTRLEARSVKRTFFRKGRDAATEAYSGFDGKTTCDECDAEKPLADWLHSVDAKRVFIVGLATDYCVKATALDAIKYGFEVVVLTDCIAAVSPGTGMAALDEMARAGCLLRTSADVELELADEEPAAQTRYFVTLARTVTELVEVPILAESAEEAIVKAKTRVWNYATNRIDVAKWHPISSSEDCTIDATPAPSARK